MIDKIDNNQIIANASSVFSNAKKATNKTGLDISINSDYSSLVEKAKQSQQDNDQVVEKARETIRTGELESIANILNAAENIFRFGI